MCRGLRLLRLFVDVGDIIKTTRNFAQQCKAGKNRRQRTYMLEREQVLSTRYPESSATSTPSCLPMAILFFDFDDALWGRRVSSWTSAVCDLAAGVNFDSVKSKIKR